MDLLNYSYVCKQLEYVKDLQMLLQCIQTYSELLELSQPEYESSEEDLWCPVIKAVQTGDYTPLSVAEGFLSSECKKVLKDRNAETKDLLALELQARLSTENTLEDIKKAGIAPNAEQTKEIQDCIELFDEAAFAAVLIGSLHNEIKLIAFSKQEIEPAKQLATKVLKEVEEVLYIPDKWVIDATIQECEQMLEILKSSPVSVSSTMFTSTEAEGTEECKEESEDDEEENESKESDVQTNDVNKNTGTKLGDIQSQGFNLL